MVRELVAIDLGNSGVRLHLGRLSTEGRLEFSQVHHFENGPVELGTRWHWDILAIWSGIENGLRKVARLLRGPATLGIDSFGVDYALLDGGGAPVGGMRHMRDPRTAGLFPALYSAVPKSELYRRTGTMEIEITTLLQLLADKRDQPWLFDAAQELHLVPDYLAFLLTGRRISEISIASTSQLVDPRARAWDLDLVRRLGLPDRLFGPIVEPGTMVGPVRTAAAERLGLHHGLEVVAVASHDTASAALAVPYRDKARSAFISFGTWALVGREIDAPDLSDASRDANFTNECGAAGAIIHHKIQAGLWLVQEVRRILSLDGTAVSFEDIEAAAERAPELGFWFDPDDPAFRDPPSMPDAIRSWFAARGLGGPDDLGALARAIYESLALACADSIAVIETLSDAPVTALHVVGGGAKISLLLQALANASGCLVVAGPVEATVAGNMVAQLVAQGAIPDFEAGRLLVNRSFDVVEYRPRRTGTWVEALARFQAGRRRSGHPS